MNPGHCKTCFSRQVKSCHFSLAKLSKLWLSNKLYHLTSFCNFFLILGFVHQMNELEFIELLFTPKFMVEACCFLTFFLLRL